MDKKKLAVAVFEDFFKNGFYIVKELSKKKFKAEFTKLTFSEYNKGIEKLKECGERGLINE